MAHAIKALLSHYDAAFAKKFGVKYPISASKDAALAKQLLALYTLDQLTAWVDDFFALEDEWIEKSGYSFGVFRSQLGKVIAVEKTPSRALDRLPAWHRRSILGGRNRSDV
jgi:hypothetical protein